MTAEGDFEIPSDTALATRGGAGDFLSFEGGGTVFNRNDISRLQPQEQGGRFGVLQPSPGGPGRPGGPGGPRLPQLLDLTGQAGQNALSPEVLGEGANLRQGADGVVSGIVREGFRIAAFPRGVRQAPQGTRQGVSVLGDDTLALAIRDAEGNVNDIVEFAPAPVNVSEFNNIFASLGAEPPQFHGSGAFRSLIPGVPGGSGIKIAGRPALLVREGGEGEPGLRITGEGRNRVITFQATDQDGMQVVQGVLPTFNLGRGVGIGLIRIFSGAIASDAARGALGSNGFTWTADGSMVARLDDMAVACQPDVVVTVETPSDNVTDDSTPAEDSAPADDSTTVAEDSTSDADATASDASATATALTQITKRQESETPTTGAGEEVTGEETPTGTEEPTVGEEETGAEPTEGEPATEELSADGTTLAEDQEAANSLGIESPGDVDGDGVPDFQFTIAGETQTCFGFPPDEAEALAEANQDAITAFAETGVLTVEGEPVTIVDAGLTPEDLGIEDSELIVTEETPTADETTTTEETTTTDETTTSDETTTTEETTTTDTTTTTTDSSPTTSPTTSS